MAQNAPKVILHLQSSNTLAHKSIVNRIENIKKEFPAAEVELVCHGPGLDFLSKRSLIIPRTGFCLTYGHPPNINKGIWPIPL